MCMKSIYISIINKLCVLKDTGGRTGRSDGPGGRTGRTDGPGGRTDRADGHTHPPTPPPTDGLCGRTDRADGRAIQ